MSKIGLILNNIELSDRQALFDIAARINEKAVFEDDYLPYYAFYAETSKELLAKIDTFLEKNEKEKTQNPRNTHRYAIRKDGWLIGAIAIDMIPSVDHGKVTYGDLGYFIDPIHGNSGIVTEAVNAILPFYFDKFDRLDITAHPANVPSNRLIKKIGGNPTEYFETSGYNSEPRQSFVVLRKDYAKYRKKITDFILGNKVKGNSRV